MMKHKPTTPRKPRYCIGYYTLEIRHIAPRSSPPFMVVCNDYFKLFNIKLNP